MLSCQEDVKTEVKSVDVPCDEKADDFLKQKPQEISLEAPADAGCSIE